MSSELDFLRQAITIRRVEERLLDLFSQGKIFGTTHTCIGQEFSAIAIANALNKDDTLFSNHRCHGHYLALTDDIDGLIAEVMGKETGVCGGVGGSQHLCNGRFFTNGIQGGIVPLATGIAFSKKIKDQSSISAVCIGDGTLGEGVIYESFNISSKWNLPVLYILENNQYAQSTPAKLTLAGSITDRAEAFDLKNFAADTWNWRNLMQVTQNASNYVREKRKPAFLLIDTYRLSSHSKSDDNRQQKEVDEYIKKDPLNIELNQNSDLEEVNQSVLQLIDQAVEKADQATYLTITNTEVPIRQVTYTETTIPEDTRQIDQLNQAIETALATYPQCIFMGEDIIAPYGGAFKASKNASNLYPDRVINTPISEAAIVGIANGLTLNGCLPIVEIMFGDFITLCFDQIVNHASKFRQMYNHQVKTPLIIRTPMGGGRRYGATHSQNLEKYLAGIPDIDLYIIHSRIDLSIFYKNLLSQIERPSIVIENKLLYGTSPGEPLPDGFSIYESDDPIPHQLIKTADRPDITIVAIGRMSLLCEEVAAQLYQEEELEIELCLPVQLSPLNIQPLLTSVKKSRAILIVEEGGESFNFASEIIAQLALNWKEDQTFHVKTVSAKNQIIPSAGPLEDFVLPNKEEIFQKALELFHESD